MCPPVECAIIYSKTRPENTNHAKARQSAIAAVPLGTGVLNEVSMRVLANTFVEHVLQVAYRNAKSTSSKSRRDQPIRRDPNM